MFGRVRLMWIGHVLLVARRCSCSLLLVVTTCWRRALIITTWVNYTVHLPMPAFVRLQVACEVLKQATPRVAKFVCACPGSREDAGKLRWNTCASCISNVSREQRIRKGSYARWMRFGRRQNSLRIPFALDAREQVVPRSDLTCAFSMLTAGFVLERGCATTWILLLVSGS